MSRFFQIYLRNDQKFGEMTFIRYYISLKLHTGQKDISYFNLIRQLLNHKSCFRNKLKKHITI